MKEDCLEIFKKIRRKSHQPEKGGKSHSAENSGKGTFLLRNGFVFHCRGFGCVQNQVLNTHGKSGQCTKSGPIALN